MICSVANWSVCHSITQECCVLKVDSSRASLVYICVTVLGPFLSGAPSCYGTVGFLFVTLVRGLGAGDKSGLSSGIDCNNSWSSCVVGVVFPSFVDARYGGTEGEGVDVRVFYIVSSCFALMGESCITAVLMITSFWEMSRSVGGENGSTSSGSRRSSWHRRERFLSIPTRDMSK